MVSWEAWALGAVVYVILAALLIKLVLSLLSPPEALPGPESGAASGSGSADLTPLQFAEIAQPLVFWGGATSAGACLAYTFPAAVDSNGVSYPGFPTTSSAVISQLQPESVLPSCLLPNQGVYQYMSQACNSSFQPGGETDPQGISQCWNLDGGWTPPGGTQYFYSSSSCVAPTACPGTLSYLSLGFFPQTGSGPGQIPLCLALQDGSPYAIECSIVDMSQQLLVSRKVPASTGGVSNSGSGSLSNSSSSGQSTVSLLKIYGVQAQGCLQPVSSNPQPVAGASGVTFGPCSLNDGYLWLSVPEQPALGGGVTPPQLVYVGNYILTYIPNHPSALVPWLQKNALSLVGSGNDVYLGSYFAQGNITGNGYLSYVTQFIDYAAFQQQITGQVCLLPGQTGCIPF